MKEKLEPEQYFKCHNGSTLESIEDLEKELTLNLEGKHMDNFEHHVNKERNDYANWIENAFNEKSLAQIIRNLDTPGKILNAIQKQKEKTPSTNTEEKQEIKPVDSEKAERLLERASLMKAKATAGTPEKIQEKKSLLNEKLEVLKEKISDGRRQGKDMLIPSLLIRNVPPKISYYEASRNESDYHAAEKLMEEVEKEIQEEFAHKEPDLKSEVLRGAGMEQKTEDE